MKIVWISIWIFLVCSGCTLSTQIVNLESNAEPAVLGKTVSFDSNRLNISEGSSAIVNIFLSEKSPTDTVLEISLNGDSNLVAPISKSITISAGTFSKALNISSIDDSVFRGTQTLSVVINPLDSSFTASPNSLDLVVSDNDFPTVTLTSLSQTVSESSGIVTLTAMLEAASSNPVTVPFTLAGTATEGVGNDFTVTASGSFTIAAGASQASIAISINDDTVAESTETIVVTLGAPSNAQLSSSFIHTVTVTDNDIGGFSISGITGVGDAVADAFLVSGVNPIVSWTSALAATSYDVTIYDNAGSGIICSLQNTVSTLFDFSSCALSVGINYKASVIAKNSITSLSAANNLFSFYVNTSPIANNDGPTRIMKGSSAITLQVVTALDSATRGTVADTDSDAGDTLSITAVTQGSSAGVVTFSGSSVTYTVPTSSFTGVESFTYTLSDNHGATAIGTVTIHVFDTYTWTGKVSANWTTNGNWCGTITNNSCNGTTGYPNSTATATMVATFDGTCAGTGHSCNSTIASNVLMYGLSMKTTYSGTITQSASFTVGIGAANFSQAGGTFTAGSGTISIASFYSQTGGTFIGSTGTIRIFPNMFSSTAVFYVGASATFTAPSLLHFNVSNGTCSTLYYYLDVPTTLSINSIKADSPGGCAAGFLSVAGGDTIVVNGTFLHSDGYLEGAWSLKGNLIVEAGADGGTWGGSRATFTFNGTGNQTYQATAPGETASIVVNKSLGTLTDAGSGYLTAASFSLALGSFTSPTGNFKINGTYGANQTVFNVATGTTFTAPQTLIVANGNGGCTGVTLTLDVPGSLTLNDLQLHTTSGCGSIYVQPAGGDTITVNGNLALNGGAMLGTFYLNGNLTIGASSAGGWGGIAFTGTGIQNITASGGFIPTGAFTVNKPSGTVTLLSHLSMDTISQTINVVAGSIDLAGWNLTLKGLSLGGNILTKNSGVLTVNGSTIGTGALLGGTVNP